MFEELIYMLKDLILPYMIILIFFSITVVILMGIDNYMKGSCKEAKNIKQEIVKIKLI